LLYTAEELCKNHNGVDHDKCVSKPNTDPCHNVIVQKYINPIITFLGIGFGLIVSIMIVIGGIQYITAGSEPQKVAAAKGRIANAIVALFAFAFMYAILQWLVPGGIF
jgi:exosortase/archaeosortase